MSVREYGAMHSCDYALFVVEENSIPAYFTVDWQPITSGMCPRCGRRLIRRRLRPLAPPTVRGTPAAR
jgi:hypothetical protein